MKTIYCEKWWRSKKRMLHQIQIKDAYSLFEKNDHFFAMIFEEESEKLTHFIEFFENGSLDVNLLDKDFDEELTIKYQIIKNHPDINSNKLFVTRLVIREKAADGTQIKGVSYNPVLFIDGQWVIQPNVFCEEQDFIKKESCNFYTKNKVDINTLYKDIPEFGDWEPLIKNTEMRFLDE